MNAPGQSEIDHQKEGNGKLYTVLRIQNRSVSLHPKSFIT